MPLRSSSSRACSMLFCALAASTAVLHAQGPTSAAIAGRILDAEGSGLSGADVFITNQATGFSIRAISRAEGRYLVGGLDVGGPYVVTVRRIGSPMNRRAGFFLSLGQELRLDIVLERQPMTLQAI